MDGFIGIVVSMPPRHGKSELISAYTPAWYLGVYPQHTVALASYEATFAERWGRRSRAILEQWGPPIFGVVPDRRFKASDRWAVGEAQGYEKERLGEMVTAGVGGPLTGRGANLLIVDDPVKNAAEAHSKVRREAIWDWWTSTAFTRLEPDAVAIVVMTRWHEDDLAGRLLQDESGRWKEIKLSAFAKHGDPLGRKLGEALWPERYDERQLDLIREQVGNYYFAAMYEQEPSGKEGGIFDRSQINIVEELEGTPVKAVRRWDIAATDSAAGDWTVGVRLERLSNGKYVVTDVIRERASAERVEQLITQTAERDGYNVRVRIEQERGSAGKLMIARYRKLLRGYNFEGVWVTGDKELRSRPAAAAVERGDVEIIAAPWNEEFLRELDQFDKGQYDDQVDAFSGAYSDITKSGQVVSF